MNLGIVLEARVKRLVLLLIRLDETKLVDLPCVKLLHFLHRVHIHAWKPGHVLAANLWGFHRLIRNHHEPLVMWQLLRRTCKLMLGFTTCPHIFEIALMGKVVETFSLVIDEIVQIVHNPDLVLVD